MTLDAFAKDLVDRFAPALPAELALTRGYEVSYARGASLSAFLAKLALPCLPGDPAKLRGMKPEAFLRDYFCIRPIWPVPLPRDIFDYAANAWFFERHQTAPAQLDFQMIARLAEAILVANPRLLAGLRATFSHVFLDEFQDTTSVQYQLFRTAFLGSSTVVTVVGDDRQRIMGWAGAMPDAFREFTNDFAAQSEYPITNYRAAPELVSILGHLSQALRGGMVMADMQPAPCSEPGGRCEVLQFSSDDQEAQVIAEHVQRWVGEGVAALADHLTIRGRRLNSGRFGGATVAVRGQDVEEEASCLHDRAA